MLGYTWALALEQSPNLSDRQWQTHNKIEIFDRLNRSRMTPMFMRQSTNRTAEENVEYKILRATRDEIVIAKKYELVTNEQSDGLPTFHQTGSGQIVFDKSTGWLKSMDMQMQIVTHENHASMTTPTSVHLQLLSPTASKLAWDQQQAAQVAAAKAQAERERPKLLDNNALNDALAKLKSVDSFRIQSGCETLEHAVLIKARQSEVATALEPLLQNTDSFVRVASAKALAVWADSKTIPALESALSSGDVFLKQSAMDALAHFPSRSVADAVAKQLDDLSVRMQAENALIKMGPVAEPSVLPMLKDPEWDVRLSACKILAAIGTQQSIPALEDLSGAEHNSLVIMDADRAVSAIRSRMK
jgi:HEAT repeat protein